MIRVAVVIVTGLVLGAAGWLAVEQWTNGYSTAAAITVAFGVGYLVLSGYVIGLFEEDE